jgi:hypothetical protein
MTLIQAQVAPARLTAVLRGAGILLNGDVIEVVVEASKDTLVSRIARLRLTYDRAATSGPSHLFLKTHREGISQQWHNIGRKEASFYDLVAVSTPADLLPRCYDVVVEPAGYWHLVLEDLTASHEPVGVWPLPPPAERWHAVVAAHARFHAAWWDDRRLGVSVGSFLDDSGALGHHVEALPNDLAVFADRLGGELSAERRRLYERLIASAPRLLERYRSHRHLTVVHGDAHVWNAMMPRDPGAKDVRLIDWDGWRVDMATDDIAYMLALHWYPEWRSRYEEETLKRYHDMLMVHGVRDYPFETLWHDYRLSVLWQIVTPMWQANHGLAPVIWWNNLERIMLAVHDLGCPELLG